MSSHNGHAHNETRTYTLTLLALLILTALTVFAAGIDFGSNTINVVIALTIATIKATLVALFFMHLLYDKPVNAVVMVTAFLFLGLFLGLSYTDVASRVKYDPINHRPPPGGPAAAAEAAKAAAKAKGGAAAPATPAATAPAPAAPAPAAEHH